MEAEELFHHFRPPLLPPPYQPACCCVAGGGAGGQYTHTYVQTDTHTQSHRPPHCVMHEGTMCSRWTLRRNTCSGTVDMQAPVVCAYRFTQWLCVCVPVCLSVLLLKRFAVSLFNEQLSFIQKQLGHAWCLFLDMAQGQNSRAPGAVRSDHPFSTGWPCGLVQVLGFPPLTARFLRKSHGQRSSIFGWRKLKTGGYRSAMNRMMCLREAGAAVRVCTSHSHPALVKERKKENR